MISNNVNKSDLEPIVFFQMPQHKQAPKSVFKLNPKSDRYRICPECGEGHMVKHRGRDFCSDKCCDDYNNKAKRLLKQSEPQQPITEEIPTNVLPVAEVPKPEVILAPVEILNGVQKNIQILNTLVIDPKEGSACYLNYLMNLGIDFNEFVSEKLHNIPSGYQANCLACGKYRIYLIDSNTVLITKTN
ncbi:MAG: hypothetical protein ACXVDZ_14295 [Bacteroidia bacterium]